MNLTYCGIILTQDGNETILEVVRHQNCSKGCSNGGKTLEEKVSSPCGYLNCVISNTPEPPIRENCSKVGQKTEGHEAFSRRQPAPTQTLDSIGRTQLGETISVAHVRLVVDCGRAKLARIW